MLHYNFPLHYNIWEYEAVSLWFSPFKLAAAPASGPSLEFEPCHLPDTIFLNKLLAYLNQVFCGGLVADSLTLP